MLHLGVLSLIPEILHGLNYGVTGRAIAKKLIQFDVWNPRDWGQGTSKRVDDAPYGGGPGMVMCYEPLAHAINHAKNQMPKETKTIYLSPQGRNINQQDLNQVIATKQNLLFIAGRYEGIDERVIEHHVDEEWSLGDFVLSGGELAAMVYIDAILRLVPGCLGDEASCIQDSFMDGLLDHPHYTRPEETDGYTVPKVLLSGDHKKINQWRRKQALGKTWRHRQDLLAKMALSNEDKQLLVEYQKEYGDI